MEMAGAGPGSAAVDAVGAVAEVADADSAGAERGPLLQPIKVIEGDSEPTEDVEDGTEGPTKTAENSAAAVEVDKGKGPAPPSDGKAYKGKGPVIVDAPRAERAGPVLWLGTGNLNRGKALVRARTPDEEDDNLRIILRESGRVSELELIKYNLVPEEITENRPLQVRTLIQNLFRFLHESSVLRRKMLHLSLNHLSQGYSEYSKRLLELRDEISTTQDEIKKSCGRVLRKTPPYLMSDPVLLPK